MRPKFPVSLELTNVTFTTTYGNLKMHFPPAELGKQTEYQQFKKHDSSNQKQVLTSAIFHPASGLFTCSTRHCFYSVF